MSDLGRGQAQHPPRHALDTLSGVLCVGSHEQDEQRGDSSKHKRQATGPVSPSLSLQMSWTQTDAVQKTATTGRGPGRGAHGEHPPGPWG